MKNSKKAQKFVQQLQGIFSPPPKDFTIYLDRLISAERERCVAVCNRVAAELVRDEKRPEAEVAWKCAAAIREEGETINRLIAESKLEESDDNELEKRKT
jgi:hypothetical protein